MKQSVVWDDGRTINVGDAIIIKTMGGEEGYDGRYGKVTLIDDAGDLHGSWGYLALITGDEFEVIHCDSDK